MSEHAHPDDTPDQVGYKTFAVTMIGAVLFMGVVFVVILPNGEASESGVDMTSPTLSGDHVSWNGGEE